MTARDGFETRAIHAGQEPDATTGAVVPPISLATTFAQDAVGVHRGYEYARSGNPTRTALESCLAALEGAGNGIAFASGLAAEDALLRTLAPGDHVIMQTDAYGGTFRLIARVHERFGIDWSAVDVGDPDELAAAWRPETRMVWIETPTNPALSIVDITAIAKTAHQRRARVVVDNTFATPYLQEPLALGADAVVHSSTKYLGGHSDVIGGFVATRRCGTGRRSALPSERDGRRAVAVRLLSRVARRQDAGDPHGPPLRERASNRRSASRRTTPLTGCCIPACPIIRGHDGRGCADAAISAGSFRSRSRAVRTPRSTSSAHTRLFTLAESLGAVESLIEHPARMTHASAAGSPLEVDPALVRLSVGIETEADLVADLTQALDALVW